MLSDKAKIGVIGAGWWADNFQIPAWRELPGVTIVALCERDAERAQASAHRRQIPAVYTDAEEMFRREQMDAVDIIASIEAHTALVALAARYGVAVICQKPMAADLASCEGMAQTCQEAGVPFLIHENMRWQSPVRALKALLEKGAVGRPFRARLQYIYNAPGIYDNQPYLKELEQLILPDLGSHLLDTARFLFGEPSSLYARIVRTRSDIRGEDVATVLLNQDNGFSCACEMSFATYTEWSEQAGLMAFVEGDKGAAELLPGFWVRLVDGDGVHAWRCPPQQYPWSGPGEEAAWCASIVDCHRDLLGAIVAGRPAETDAADNLKTMRILFKAYESAALNQAIRL